MSDKFTVTPPWCLYYRQLCELFGNDPEINLFFDESTCTINIYVQDNSQKAHALSLIIPACIDFEGDVSVKIRILCKDVIKAESLNNLNNIFDIAFKGNPAYKYCESFYENDDTYTTYVVFAKQVVQIYVDNTSDLNRVYSTLYQDIASDVLTHLERVHYCTDTEDSSRLKHSVPINRPLLRRLEHDSHKYANGIAPTK